MRKVLMLITVSVISAALMLVGLSACQQVPAAIESVEEAVQEVAEEVAEPAAKMDLLFGNNSPSLSDEWNGYSIENFKYAADLKGVRVQVTDAAWDNEKQLNDFQDLINRGADAIGVYVWTPESAEQFATIAAEEGMPIFFENTKLSSDLIDYEFQGDYIFNVACEYDNIGYQAIKWIDEEYPGARIFYVRGAPGMGIVEAYEAGVERAIAESTSGTTIAIRRDTNWDTQSAQPEATDVLTAGEEFDAIFANNEPIAQGVYNALQDAGLAGTVPIIATGGGPTGLKLFDEGVIDATVAAPVSLQGLWLFKAMYLYTTQGIVPPEKFIPLPNMVITPDNFDENISWIPSMELIDYIGGLDSW
jgi:ABC-type sugar transport system substrate-binding protein